MPLGHLIQAHAVALEAAHLLLVPVLRLVLLDPSPFWWPTLSFTTCVLFVLTRQAGQPTASECSCRIDATRAASFRVVLNVG